MNKPFQLPVSIKGIVFESNQIWLRKNQRNEWELPGGKMDEGEQPKETCKREINEELGYNVEVGEIIQAYLYTIKVSPYESKGVLVISYLCNVVGKMGDFEHEWEEGNAEFKLFPIDSLAELNMPQFYKDAIIKAAGLLNENNS